MNINRVTIAGNITKELSLKSTPSGTKVLQFTLATNRTWKDQNGQKQEEVQYVDFVSFGKQAETIAQYCVKGQNMFCEGRYTTRSWEDKDTGQKRYKTEVILEEFQFGSKPQGSSNNNSSNQGRDDDGFNDFSRNEVEVTGKGVDPEDIGF